MESKNHQKNQNYLVLHNVPGEFEAIDVIEGWPQPDFEMEKVLKQLIKTGDVKKYSSLLISTIQLLNETAAKEIVKFFEKELKRQGKEYMKIYRYSFKSMIKDPHEAAKNFNEIYKSVVYLEDERDRNIKIPNYARVVATGRNEKYVYLRSMEYEYILIYSRVFRALQEDAKYFDKLKTIPQVGDVVVMKIYGNYNRAIVISNDNLNKIRVQRLDSGDYHYGKMNDMLAPTKYYIDLPGLVMPVVLKNLSDSKLYAISPSFLGRNMSNQWLTLKYKRNDINADGIYKVELFDEENCLKYLMNRINKVEI